LVYDLLKRYTMKKILVIIIGLCLSVFLQSCNEEEFLREEPRDDIFAENLFLSYDGFNNGLNAVYALVREGRTGKSSATYTDMWKMGTDNAFINQGAGHIDPFNDYTKLHSENSIIENNFEWLYKIVNSTNMIINRAENSHIDWQGFSADEDMENMHRVVGQARLIRAWAYRHLKFGWGAVPLSLEEISGTTYRNDWERAPVSAINDQMEQDLIYARDNLAMIEETGRVNSAVASTMLAELYLELGEDEKAETEALRVINDGQYQLMTNRFGVTAGEPGVPFSDLFDSPRPEDGNLEVLWVLNNAYRDVVGSEYLEIKNIWITDYRKDNILKNVDNMDILHTYNGGKGTGRISVSDSAFAWYEEFDDRYSYHCVKKFYIYPNPESPSGFDTLRWTNMDYDDPDDLEDHFQWPWVTKWDYNDPYVLENAGRSGQYNDQMYMRLAETYLLAAEALMNQGKNQQAADLLNELRARSNASQISASDVTLEFILKERSRELVSEEYRKHTLIRTGKFLEWAIKYNPRLDESKVFPHNVLMPIPQEILDANTDAVMEQNPGYN
jgi:hypothetical protein